MLQEKVIEAHSKGKIYDQVRANFSVFNSSSTSTVSGVHGVNLLHHNKCLNYFQCMTSYTKVLSNEHNVYPQTEENLNFLLVSRQKSFEIGRSFCTVYHLLDMFNLRVTKSVLFEDVISDASLTIRFSSGSTRLQVKFLASCLQILQTICSPARNVNMDRFTHSIAQVSLARVDNSIHFIKR